MDLFEVLAVISDWLYASAYKNMILLRSLSLCIFMHILLIQRSIVKAFAFLLFIFNK